MTKRSQKKPSPGINWWAILTDPLLQQILALGIVATGVITLLTLFRVTQGRWANAWVNWLRHWFGWGVYPVAATILLAGLLWLQHHLDHPLKWRWRPFVGAELAFFSLLALTHTILGRGDAAWGLVDPSQGGGLIGWAVSVTLSNYVGWPVAAVILLALAILGLGLTFDVTAAEAWQTAAAAWIALTNRRPAARPARPAAQTERPRPARPAPAARARPASRPTTAPPEPAPPRQARPVRTPRPATPAPAPIASPLPPPHRASANSRSPRSTC